MHQVNPAYSFVIGRVKFMERYGLTVHQAAALVLGPTHARLFGAHPAPLGLSCRQWRSRRLHRTREEAREARVGVLGCDLGAAETGRLQHNTGWGSGGADPIRLRLSCGQRLAGWLERGPARCYQVRFPGGAALHCWGGGAAETASLEKADDRLVTKVNLCYNGSMLTPSFLSRCVYLPNGSSRRVILLSSTIAVIIAVLTLSAPSINPGEGATNHSGFQGDNPGSAPNTITTSSLEYLSISAGLEHTCGVLKDGTPYCWGNNRDSRASVPNNIVFKTISAGSETLLRHNRRRFRNLLGLQRRRASDSAHRRLYKRRSAAASTIAVCAPAARPNAGGVTIMEPRHLPPTPSHL